MPGKKYASIQNVRMYKALKRKFGSSPAAKTKAAKITNAMNPPGINRRAAKRGGRRK